MEKYTYRDVDRRGQLCRVEYTTQDKSGAQVAKYANVYIPWNYDPRRQYNILYLMHGGGGNADAFLDSCPVKNMLDYVISEGSAEEMIVVFPSYYKSLKRELRQPGSFDERDETLFFQKELRSDLIPAVESAFSTYAQDVTPEGIKASRMHRAFGGFSMGGCTTWFALMNNIENIAWFLPLSGDCWELDIKGGLTKPRETAAAIADSILSSGYKPGEYFIYAATGTNDIAYDALTAQIEAMRKYPDVFREKDLRYFAAEGEYHTYQAVFQYLYGYIGDLFRCTPA